MATRRIGRGNFDHGAQFFTVRANASPASSKTGSAQASPQSGRVASPTRRVSQTKTVIPATGEPRV